MADNRKYYYLKLKESYFDDDAIVLLESMQDGVIYSNILLKLYLKSLKNGGKLQLDENIPYTAQMIATITRQQVGTVERALKIFMKLGLVEPLPSGALYMSNIELLIGQSSTEGERKRRARLALQEQKALPQTGADKCPPYRADICPPEIEIEKEIDIEDYDDLGRYYIDELEVMQIPEHLQNYIDYEAYGRDVAMDENGSFTDQGYVRDTGDRFCEYYDGERGSIPDEYRVMSFQNDLSEEEKSEWAMDIAFDMDEFFRQNDPQYAAEHPEAHAAKEEIHENLMAGRISALEEKMAALGQTQEDYLPSEIEKFKDATGYEEFLDFDPAEVKAALEDPNRSRVDEMLAAAEKAEREYAAEAATYAQIPADIVAQARAAQGDTFSIYQLKPGDSTRDYRFEPLDTIRNNGLSVKPENYEQVYTAPLTAKDDLESIYTRFNVDRPADFTGHSLSVSDIVVLHQDGKDTAHYCDRFGFSQVPEFLQPERAAEVTIPTPDQMATRERISTPRGSFCVTAMSREQMEAAGYGVHHQSDDGKYLIMGNGTRAFAIPAQQQPEQDNPLRTAEMTLEDDYGMIDGVINNGRRGEELEKAREHAERTQPEKKPSIRERLAAAKQECAKQQPRPATEKKPPELGER